MILIDEIQYVLQKGDVVGYKLFIEGVKDCKEVEFAPSTGHIL